MTTSAEQCFRFRRFTVRQGRSAMKVGTDGTLLGAWARAGGSPPVILDIGTGTGLIALMMAQRYADALVTAIDIDPQACLDAADNVAASPFARRISVVNTSLQTFDAPPASFTAIVCNPPFFTSQLQCPDERRNMARHAAALPYRDLFAAVARLLAPGGQFSAIIPVECRQAFETEAVMAGLFTTRICDVRTTPAKPPRRRLLTFGNTPPAALDRSDLVIGSDDYRRLTDIFYLSEEDKG